MNLKELIQKGESKTLEFKETFRYNTQTLRKDRGLKFEVARAVYGMLNSDGGTLLIGVADDKSIMGLERDLELYGKGDEASRIDKLRIDLNKHITDTIGIESKKFLSIEFIELEGKKVIKIDIEPSYDPFFYSEEGNFYIRDGPRTIELSGKKMGKYISERSKTPFVNQQKKLNQEKLKEISNKFQDWANNKLKSNLDLWVNKHSQDGLVYDYIFGCIIPLPYTDNMINFGTDLIKNYIDEYSIIKDSQTYKTYELARQFREDIGEDILIYPDGIMYFCINYSFFKPEEPRFSLGYLENGTYQRLDVQRYQEKYNAPFSFIKWGTLESLIEVLCFIFHPECNVRIVSVPTESFSLELILPNMIINGRQRKLLNPSGLPSYKKYLGTKKDINIYRSYVYSEIPEIVDSIIKEITSFFQNPATRAYGYL